MKEKTLHITLLALFIALSAVGGSIKVAGSIAFDSTPAFLGALLIGAPEGALIGAAGHLFSALLAGFPLTLPMHLAIAAEMAGICFVTGWLYHRVHAPLVVASFCAFALNGFASPLIMLIWPGFGLGALLPLWIPLIAASAANVVVASLLQIALKKPYSLIGQNSRRA